MDNEFFKTIFSAVDKNEDLILNAERYIWKNRGLKNENVRVFESVQFG